MRVSLFAPIAVVIVSLCMPPGVLAQQEPPASREGEEKLEEVIVVGARSTLQLRVEMWELEREAYDIFNKFNGEKRFDTTCSVQQPTGSHVNSDTQLCQPNFVLDARAMEGQASFESTREMLNQWAYMASNNNPPPMLRDTPPPVVPAAAAIASQQKPYRERMRQVAEQQPEFLQAMIRYTEAKARYEQARGLRN